MYPGSHRFTALKKKQLDSLDPAVHGTYAHVVSVAFGEAVLINARLWHAGRGYKADHFRAYGVVSGKNFRPFGWDDNATHTDVQIHVYLND